ncbi:MAG: ankyrin repeat domain-containing protein [Pseudomonadota bacterium]
MILRIGCILAILALTACAKPDPPTLPFYTAVQRGDLDQIERHIFWNTDINAPDPEGATALHAAARLGRRVIAETLLDHGADMNAKNAAGRTPLNVAIAAGRTQVADMLVRHGAPFDPDRILFDITLAGISDRDVVDFLVRRGADLDHRDPSGRTPLIAAVENNDRLMVKLLVSRGADVNLGDTRGRLPLDVAEETGNEAIIRYLHRNGARGTPAGQP